MSILGISDKYFGPCTGVSSDLHHIFLIWEMILGPVGLASMISAQSWHNGAQQLASSLILKLPSHIAYCIH